jgi:hypothetical protein
MAIVTIRAGTSSQNVQINDELSGVVKKRNEIDDCVTLLQVRFLLASVPLIQASEQHYNWMVCYGSD